MLVDDVKRRFRINELVVKQAMKRTFGGLGE
jgi:hypothetical protein